MLAVEGVLVCLSHRLLESTLIGLLDLLAVRKAQKTNNILDKNSTKI